MRKLEWMLGSLAVSFSLLSAGCPSASLIPPPSSTGDTALNEEDSGSNDEGNEDASGEDTSGEDGDAPAGSGTGADGSDDDNNTGAGVDEFLPDAITLDISELPEDPDADSSSAKSAAAANTIEDGSSFIGVRRTIFATGAIVNGFQLLADRSLALGRAIRFDMDDPSQTQVEGRFFAGGQLVSFKADFAAFDIDGDGVADGSGMPDVEPVAVRIWVDQNDGNGFEPFLCALITQRPSSENLGSGQMYAKPSQANALLYGDAQFFAQWDRTDPSHKWNETWIRGQIRPAYSLTIGHQRVDWRSDELGALRKTVRSSSQISESPAGFASFTFASHYVVGDPFVLVSANSTGGDVQVDFSQVCVDLDQAALATQGECSAFDLQDFDLLPAPVGDEADFPLDFPAAPTF